jgi:hypothetical protein
MRLLTKGTEQWQRDRTADQWSATRWAERSSRGVSVSSGACLPAALPDRWRCRGVAVLDRR